MNDRLETTILNNLFFNEDFTRKAIPFLKEHYFSKRDEKILFIEVEKFLHKYNNLPTKKSILIELNNRKDLNEEEYKNVKDLVATISNEDTDLQWLLDTTEKFCKDRAVHNAVLEGIKILDGKDLSLIHISEPTRQEAISYAVFCLKKKKNDMKTHQL